MNKTNLALGFLLIFIISTVTFIILWRKEVKKKQSPGPSVEVEVEVPVYKKFKNSENNILGFDYSENVYLNSINKIEDALIDDIKQYFCNLDLEKIIPSTDVDKARVIPCEFIRYYIKLIQQMDSINSTYDESKLKAILKKFSNDLNLKHTDVELLPITTSSKPNQLIDINIYIDEDKMFLILKTEILTMLDELVKDYCKEGDKSFTWEELNELYSKIVKSFCNLSEE